MAKVKINLSRYELYCDHCEQCIEDKSELCFYIGGVDMMLCHDCLQDYIRRLENQHKE